MTEFSEVVRNRRMTRAYSTRPIDADVLDRMVDLAARAPSAGKTQGWHLVVLEGADTARYWDITLPEPKRSSFRWQRLLDAPVLMVVLADPDAYVERYAEPDKARTGLGESIDAWPTPYWTVDASMSAMTLLHAAEDEGLGALFFGVFQREAEVRSELGIPDRMQIIGAITLGHLLGRDGDGPVGPGEVAQPGDGRSAQRRRRKAQEIIHRARFVPPR
ncbi:MAG: nitroreductase family protein [Ilumatobacter sp.]